MMSDVSTYPAEFAIEVNNAVDLPVAQPHEHINDVDPRADNTLRAKFAAEGIKAYAKRTGVATTEGLDTAVGDFLGDLMHLCDALGLDFDGMVDSGRYHYEPELRGTL